MPYVSRAQQGFFHSPAARKAGITSFMVKEWDAASKGHKHLPARVKPKPRNPHGIGY